MPTVRSSRPRRACGIAAVAFGCAIPADRARGQGPAGVLWDSYRSAADVLRRGVEAHGGEAAIRGLAAVSFGWEGRDYAPMQGWRAGWDSTRNGRRSAVQVDLDFARARFLVDFTGAFPGGYVNHLRLVGFGRQLLSYDPTGEFGGTTFGRDTSGAGARGALAGFGGRHPLPLLRRALDAVPTLRHLGTATVDGRRERVIGFSDAEGRAVTLAFDARTGLLARAEDVGVGSLGDEVDAWRFAAYDTVAGFVVPRRAELTFNGRLAGRYARTRFAPAAAIPDTADRAPAGYTPRPPAAPPAVVRVGDGVYFVERIGGGYRSLVVDTDEGLVVVDAPVSAAATQQAIALIEQTLPGRPFRYVVITHHHGDHTSGIPAYAARGATILVGPGSESYLRTQSVAPRTIGRLAPPAAAPAPRIEPLRGRRTIGRGGRAVEVIDVGPTAHAAAMLVAYVPSERLLFQGDLLRINEAGGPARSPEALADLVRLIARHALDVQTIGAVHGRNGTIAELRQALAAQTAAR